MPNPPCSCRPWCLGFKPDLAHLVSFLCVVDGVESGFGVVGDGVFSGDDGVAGLDVDGSVAA